MEVRNWDNEVLFKREADSLDDLIDQAKTELDKPEVAEIRIRKKGPRPGNQASRLQKDSGTIRP